MASWGAQEPWAVVSCGGGVGSLLFEGAGSSEGQAGPPGRHRRRLGGLARCCRVLGGGGGLSRPPWTCRVGVFCGVRWVRRRGGQVVRVQWLLGGLSQAGVGFGGPGSFGVEDVAGRIRLLVGGGRSLLVSWVVGLSSWWVLRPSQVMVLLVHGGLLAHAVEWWAVVVVLGLVVVVVVVVGVFSGVLVVVVVVVVLAVGTSVAVVVVVGLVVVVVLWARPKDPLAFP